MSTTSLHLEPLNEMDLTLSGILSDPALKHEVAIGLRSAVLHGKNSKSALILISECLICFHLLNILSGIDLTAEVNVRRML